ncbi:MAG TPA: response regulator transcription factor [Stellaceae bacterium]|nr:response regulator transcription factor [Stellaceae bacterium]
MRAYASTPTAAPTPTLKSSVIHAGHTGTPAAPTLLPRIYIISQTLLFREGLKAMLTRQGALDVVGDGSPADALREIGNLAPQLVLLDMGGLDSLAVPRQLRVILPDLQVVAVALAEQGARIVACAEAGICAYVAQNATIEDLVAAILRSLNGEVICPPKITALLFDRVASLASNRLSDQSAEPLTRREREIAAMMASGLQNKEIARRLCLGNATVKNHVHNILQKLRIQRRTEILGRHFM